MAYKIVYMFSRLAVPHGKEMMSYDEHNKEFKTCRGDLYFVPVDARLDGIEDV